MHLIQPVDPHHIAETDVTYIANVLGLEPKNEGDFKDLCSDPEIMDEILDNQAIYTALTGNRSEKLMTQDIYLYVVVRHALQRVGLDDRKLAGYLAGMLREYASTPRDKEATQDMTETVYLVDLLRAVQRSSPEGRFFIRTHIGNYALYITGIFPERLRYKSRRRSMPDFIYYEELGQSTYEAAAQDRMAWEFGVHDVFQTLAQNFRKVRMALNELAERELYHGDPFGNLYLY